MPIRPHLGHLYRSSAIWLGVITLGSVFMLLVWDIRPKLFPVTAHNLLGALPLALIAVAHLLYQFARHPGAAELIKAVLLATAFLLWAANQLWPEAARATLYNDLAIALFVLDVFLVMVGWPWGSPDESFAESFSERLEKD